MIDLHIIDRSVYYIIFVFITLLFSFLSCSHRFSDWQSLVLNPNQTNQISKFLSNFCFMDNYQKLVAGVLDPVACWRVSHYSVFIKKKYKSLSVKKILLITETFGRPMFTHRRPVCLQWTMSVLLSLGTGFRC